MRICLITPSHLVMNPRLVKNARVLRGLGHDISVVCGQFSRWGIQSDPEIAAEFNRTVTVPFGPIGASQGTYLRQSLVRHAARLVSSVLGLCRGPIGEAAHHPVQRDLRSAAVNVRADLYIAHYVAALPAAAAAAKHNDGVYAFDAEDFHLGDLPDLPIHRHENSIIRAIEETYLPNAVFVTAAAPLIAKAYHDVYKIPLPTTILNVFPRTNAPPAPTKFGTTKPGPSLYWFSQVIGPGRGLEDAVRSLRIAESHYHLYLRGNPADGYWDHLQQIAKSEGVTNRLHFLDVVEPSRLEGDGARFDIGYAGDLAETPNRSIALTNKLFSYLSSGIPIVATDIPAHKDLVPQLGNACVLVPLHNPSALAAAIDLLLSNPTDLAARRKEAWNLGQTTFSWESQIVALTGRIEIAMSALEQRLTKDKVVSCPIV